MSVCTPIRNENERRVAASSQAEWMRLRTLLPTEVGLSRPAAKGRPAPSPSRQRSGRRRATVGVKRL